MKLSMKLAGSHKALFLLLATAAVVKQSHGLGDCSELQDEGTHFSVTASSCINYTAVFSWNLRLNLADTRLELSCHNDTSDFSPLILTTSRRDNTESFEVPLDGTVRCNIAGCYEDKDNYEEWLIPVTSFTCQPPPPPAVITSSPSLSPSLSISHAMKTPPLKLSSTSAVVTETSTPTHTADQQTDQSLVVIIAIPPSVASTFLVFIIILVTFCVCRSQRKSDNNYSEKYALHLQQTDKFDANYEPRLISHQRSMSSHTVIEPPVTTDEPSISRSTSVPTSECDSESENSQEAFPSLSSELVSNVLVKSSETTPCDDTAETCIKIGNQSQQNPNSACPTGTVATYMQEPAASVVTSSNNTALLSRTQLEGDTGTSSHFSIPCLVDSSGIDSSGSGVDTDEQWNSEFHTNIGDMGSVTATPHTMSPNDGENTQYIDTDSGVQLYPTYGTMYTNEWGAPQSISTNEWGAPQSTSTKERGTPQSTSTNKWGVPQSISTNELCTPQLTSTNELGIPQSTSTNDINEEEVAGCDEEDEIMKSIVERYKDHTQTLPHFYSQNTSSGFGSQSYVCAFNGRSTEH